MHHRVSEESGVRQITPKDRAISARIGSKIYFETPIICGTGTLADRTSAGIFVAIAGQIVPAAFEELTVLKVRKAR